MVVRWSAVICLLKYATTVMPPSSCFCISIAFTSKELVSVGSSVDRFGSKIIVVSILFASLKFCFCLSSLVSHVINSTILAKFRINFLKKLVSLNNYRTFLMVASTLICSTVSTFHRPGCTPSSLISQLRYSIFVLKEEHFSKLRVSPCVRNIYNSCHSHSIPLSTVRDEIMTSSRYGKTMPILVHKPLERGRDVR